ncbi:hypothetical protein ACSSWA_10110 [Melioribacter sp. Ez-97]|uniref:hypothetical protein n=1 Tax=Melioribacter sp. Ez-97 TaxID=3423434 RepID=UPI003EDA8377
MHRFLLLFILSFSLTNAQSLLGQKDYKSQHDSLTSRKNNLLNYKSALKNEIDSLKNESKKLDSLIEKAEREIEAVYVKKFGRKYGPRVYHKQIWKGMTEEMLRAGWGKPDRIDKNVEKWGVFTQWYYGKITFFFRDGKLIDWEEEK